MDLLLKYDLPTLALVLALIAVIVCLSFYFLFSVFVAPPKKNLACSRPVSPFILI